MSPSGASGGGARSGRRPRLEHAPQAAAVVELRKRKRQLGTPPLAPSSLPLPKDRDSYSSTAFGEVVDRSVHAALARLTLGLSPAALAECYLDWATHLAMSPGKQLQLVQKSARKLARLAHQIGECASGRGIEPCIQPLPQDRRFEGEAWQQWPYNLIYQSFLAAAAVVAQCHDGCARGDQAA